MRPLYMIVLVVMWLPALSQKPLVITDARKANPVAPYVYYLEDFTHKLTYEQVSRFPLDSFQALNQQEVVQLSYRKGKIWMRIHIHNQTGADLFLISSVRKYRQLDIFIKDESENLSTIQSGLQLPIDKQTIPTVPPIIPLGTTPKLIHISLFARDAIGDYLHIGDVGEAILYPKKNAQWQNLALGAYLIVLIYSIVFFLRLRDALIGWYALLILSYVLFYVDFYGFIAEKLPSSFHWKKYFPTTYFYMFCWSFFHIKFLNLKQYSKTLYWLLLGLSLLCLIDYPIFCVCMYFQIPYTSVIDKVIFGIGIDHGQYILIVLFLQLVCLLYVCSKDFKKFMGYAIAFSISLGSMIISMFALYNIEWLPLVPYNNAFVPGILVEVAILGYILAERASEHRRQQNQTQQALIAQLQENLRQRDKLLHIRDEIARDLHDEVGATLTSIAISTKLVQKKMGLVQPEISPLLEQIKVDSEETIHSIRDTVWALNPDNDVPEKFVERLRNVAHQMLSNVEATLTFDCEVDPKELPLFSMEQRRNIYLTFKESIHNIVKHAQASKVEVRLWRQEDTLRMQIRDNGHGFETPFPPEGNGLINFQKRAEEGGFSVRITSSIGQGTTIILSVPIRKPDEVALPTLAAP
ncbi:7TM diverse intracellular signaling domain-containing protein [Telluribacter sp. SYSU D00476]|uniref:sensor histidine kinase n=1 Tax=Telluribacter sp. SYSU D00476 TaxID=2811430 RepID=UPI00286DDF9D|nr:7TM diverse intracellular signaling domain-containing protein [Telluribacter sp. SYSU D00476]